jgi:radical SAM superfamily enzyme YgiQ (UPF0313 family)
LDLLLTHGYFLRDDPVELQVMRPYAPLGILYLNSYLKARGWESAVFDSTFQSEAQLIAHARRTRPTSVGISTNLMTRKRIVPLMRALRDAVPGVRIVVGGPDASSSAERYVEHGADVAVRGEGEETLHAVLTAWRDGGSPAGIAGTTVAHEGRITTAPDRALIVSLESHPWPDREAIDFSPYLKSWNDRHGYSSMSLTTARGCPYSCRWCSRSVYGASHRRRPVDDVVREIAAIRERYAPDRLWFVDDVFTIHKGWTLALAEALGRANLTIPFECISRAERIDAEVADALQRMRCARVWIGTESGSQRILNAMDRRVRVEQIQEGTRLLRERGIEVGFFIMVGYSGEDESDLEATVQHIRRSAPDVVLTTVAYPIHGTPYQIDLGPRAVNDRPWAETSDRETEVRGRAPRRYYDFARAWIEADAASHRLQRQGHRWRALAWRGRAGWARLRMRRAGPSVL